jgi:hypothetical protein
MEFPNLTNDNIRLYAIKHYDNPACHSTQEFSEDFDRVKYIKRLLKRYQTKGVLKERLVLNHIIIIYNVFGVEAATRILFFRLESDLWPILKTILVFLNYMPDRVTGIDGKTIVSSFISLNSPLIDKLRNIGNGGI